MKINIIHGKETKGNSILNTDEWRLKTEEWRELHCAAAHSSKMRKTRVNWRDQRRRPGGGAFPQNLLNARAPLPSQNWTKKMWKMAAKIWLFFCFFSVHFSTFIRQFYQMLIKKIFNESIESFNSNWFQLSSFNNFNFINFKFWWLIQLFASEK